MPIFVWVVILSICGGIAFAALAVWLTTTRGNTIADIMNSKHFKEASAVAIEIEKTLKLSTNIPIVGLYIVGFAVAVGSPWAYMYFTSPDVRLVYLRGDIRPAVRKVCLTSKDMRVESTGSFAIPLLYKTQANTITIDPEQYYPVTLNVDVNVFTNQVTVNATTDAAEEQQLRLEPNTPSIRLKNALQLTPIRESEISRPENKPIRDPAKVS